MPERYPQPKVESVRKRVKALLVPQDRGYETPCYIWTGIDLDRNGYGRVKWQGRYVPVHRVFLLNEASLFAPPEGMEIDHLCKQRTCCRPSHLEWVTRQENLERRGK
jgi:hypothetical protein